MSFNWFNRQYNEQSAKPAEPAEAAPAQPEPSAEPAKSEPPAIAEDYLSWAKAAYKNIQKRQAETAQPEGSEAPTEPAASPEEALAETVETTQVATPVEPDITPVEAAIEAAVDVQPEAIQTESSADVTPEAAIADVQAVEDVAIAPAPLPEPEADPVAEPALASTEISDAESAAPLPFWAKAEAERLERLERLKAEAIEEEAAMAQAAAATTETAPVPDVTLDENFIWSAQVLAAQGRRPDQVDLEEITWLKRLRQGLDKTRRNLINQLKAIVGQGPLNQDAVMEIESLLLQADVGVEATDYIIDALQTKLRQEALPPEEAIAYLKQIIRDMLDNPAGKPYDPTFTPDKDTLNIWLITGVNGAGKTTTIGKIAHIAQKSGYRSLIGAADTFRAAAVQQVKVWGDRSNVEVISNPGKNTDPAAVVFDAITAAQARNTELLLIDTAGRLQNKKNLMDELSKIRRIIDKKAPDARIESLLVLDATLGQNGLRQAEVFSEVAQLSGVVLTKLDGTAKGGIALAVVKQLGLPIRFIGAGEGIEDLRPFSSYEFVEALLSG
ncbi:MAG TPA: signal recognition particle-docking protein FtsY [Crinalium sp.]